MFVLRSILLASVFLVATVLALKKEDCEGKHRLDFLCSWYTLNLIRDDFFACFQFVSECWKNFRPLYPMRVGAITSKSRKSLKNSAKIRKIEKIDL